MALGRNISWALRGNIVYAVTQWTLLIILAKMGGPETVGRYTLGLAVTAPIVLFADLQLRSLLASDVNGEYQFDEYVLLRALTSSLALISMCGIVLGFGYTAQQATVILLIGLAKLLESSSDILYGYMQKNDRMDLIGISKMVRGVITVPIFGLTLYLTDSLVIAVVSLALVWVFGLICIDCRNILKLGTSPFIWKYGLSSWSLRLRTRLLSLAWHALPLGIVSMLISYNNAVPRYFVEAYHGEAALGYFSAIACLSVAITIIVEALGQAALPRLARYYEGQLLTFWGLLLKLSAVALGIGCLSASVSIFIGGPLLGFIYRPEYGQFTDVLVLVMMLGALESLCSVLGVGLTVARVLRFQVPVLMMVLSITIIAGWWLIPQHGMKGAVWASILASTAWVVLYGSAMGSLLWRSMRQ